ncbi:hypothetical protein [uncultured Arcanobacterium sp.]|uniref:hypothetical protein n=1 Tax=uncultured Arcanobacterium sp. TaxID=487520 RepID=UPI002618CCE7|nr:hypothetical protein [uncultured Arcanobacterium sp.]
MVPEKEAAKPAPPLDVAEALEKISEVNADEQVEILEAVHLELTKRLNRARI